MVSLARRSWLARSVAVAAAVCVGLAAWWGWSRYVAPTRVAFVNYEDFQLARIVRARGTRFVRVERLGLNELDRAARYPLVFVFGRGLTLNESQRAALQGAGEQGTRVFVEGATDPASDVTNVRGRALDALGQYLQYGGPVNYRNLLAYARRDIDGKALFAPAVSPPQAIGQDVYFHLGDDHVFASYDDLESYMRSNQLLKPGRPRIAVLATVPGPFNSNRDHVDALISALIARDFNVFPIASNQKRLSLLRLVQPDLVVMMPHGRLASAGDAADDAVSWLKERNIPVLTPLSVFEEFQRWSGDQKGYQGALMTMNVVLPELDGGVSPYTIAAQFRDEQGYLVFKAIPGRLERFVDMVDHWVTLRTRANKDKRIAIYYFKGPGNNALTASEMEVLPSLFRMLQALQREGYTVTGLPEDEKAFGEIIMRRGPVLGPYARGAFDDYLAHGDPALVDVPTYEEWAKRAIAPALWDGVERAFGKAPGEYMAVRCDNTDSLAIARVEFGNVVVLPQPLAGLGDDTFKVVHGTKTAPPHPYVASYLWARNAFKADALIHLGTHGSLEFTPWKQVALSDQDWSDALIGSTPHFYVYIISNVGEGLIAKRRSYATTVTHLTPPFKESGVYSDLARLRDRVMSYQTVSDPAVRGEYRKDLIALAITVGVHKDLSLSDNGASWSEDDVLRICDHVENLAHEKIASGLYTWSNPYPDNRITSTAGLMALDPVAYALARLDVSQGKVKQEQADNAVFFDKHYRQTASGYIARVQRGEDPDEVLRGALPPERLDSARAWRRQKEQVDLTSRASPPASAAKSTRGGALPASELELLVVGVLADAGKRDYLDRLKADAEFKRASSLLDPGVRARAKSIAAAIPAMKAALEVAEQPDVQKLVEAMQTDDVRARVFAMMADAALASRVEAQQRRLEAESVATALEPQRVAALRRALSGKDIENGSTGDLHQTTAALRWFVQHRRIASAVRASGTGDAAAVADALDSGRLTAALDTLERQVAQRTRENDEAQSTVLTVADALAGVRGYESALRDSPEEERRALINALNGGYIPPQSGGDPIGSPAAIPSGRNLYGIDAERTPSEPAWTVGVRMGEALLAEHRKRHENQYPRKVAFTFFPGDFISTEGALVAEVFYLLGAEPVRNAIGNVVDVRLIPPERLNRPRVDVVVQTSGQFRDIGASRLYLINKAVRLAAEAREDEAANFVKVGAAKAEDVMKAKGFSPVEARELATMRIFGGVNGNYGTQIMNLVEKGDRWESEAEVATRYLGNMGAMYDEGRWSEFKEGVFEAALQDTEVVVQPRESNTWGALSLDHVYEFMGGLSLAARFVTGKDPDAYFDDFRNPQRAKTTELKETIWTEARTTLLNPAYIADLTRGGASSAEKFAETFRNVYGWNVMKPKAVDQELWNELYATYVDDVRGLGLRGFFEQQNPYALQEMTAVMMETARKGYWKATDTQLRTLAKTHAELVRDHHAGCSEFVCDNPKLRQAISAQLGDEAVAQAYEDGLEQARTGNGANRTNVVLERQSQQTSAASKGIPRPSGRLLAGAAVLAVVALVAAFVLRKRRAS